MCGAYHVPSAVPGVRSRAVNKTKVSVHEACIYALKLIVLESNGIDYSHVPSYFAGRLVCFSCF